MCYRWVITNIILSKEFPSLLRVCPDLPGRVFLVVPVEKWAQCLFGFLSFSTGIKPRASLVLDNCFVTELYTIIFT